MMIKTSGFEAEKRSGSKTASSYPIKQQKKCGSPHQRSSAHPTQSILNKVLICLFNSKAIVWRKQHERKLKAIESLLAFFSQHCYTGKSLML